MTQSQSNLTGHLYMKPCTGIILPHFSTIDKYVSLYPTPSSRHMISNFRFACSVVYRICKLTFNLRASFLRVTRSSKEQHQKAVSSGETVAWRGTGVRGWYWMAHLHMFRFCVRVSSLARMYILG